MTPGQTPIKVLHLITLLELGGAQGNTLHTVYNLNPELFESHLWCGKGAFWDTEAQKNLGEGKRLRFFPNLIRSIHPVKDFLALIQLTLAIKKLKPVILHTHSSKAGILGRLAGWLAGVPILIHTYHGFGFNDRQLPWTRLLFIGAEKIMARVSTRLIFVSQANLDLAQTKKIGTPSRYVLIRSGIPVKNIKAAKASVQKNAYKTQLGLTPDFKLVSTVGPFKPQKNLADFLDVARAIANQSDEVEFVLIGDGDLRPELMKKAETLNLQKKVRFLGWRQDVHQLLAISDLFAMTSLWEGLPRALVEALIMDVPAVCYDTDGVRDLLSKGGGFLIPQGQIERMAQKITEILKSQTYPQLSHQHKSEIEVEFDITGMVKTQEDLYLALLEAKRPDK